MQQPTSFRNGTWLGKWLLCCVLLAPFLSMGATDPTNATVRVPRNIRVLQTNGIVDYVSLETYVGRVLYQEWYASWASYSGGSNSLKSGAVVIRSYAINKLQNVGTNSTSDICATTSCQVYRPTSNSSTVSAAAQTAGYVVTSSAFTIQGSEYSAENNSAGFSCGDGYTSPTGGCIFDPVCTGETRFGHGRGLCQWGSAKWATGLKMAGNGGSYPANANSGVTNGYPKQTWDWIINHYYPTSILVPGKPLIQGDDVKTTIAIQVRMNADGSISNATAAGMNAPFIMTKAANSTGVIVTNSSNYVLVTNDNFGFTWYKIRWSDGTIGWSPENWLQRIVPAPGAPFSLTATGVSPSQINLSWGDTNVTELGFEIQRSPITNGNWSQLDTVAPNVYSYADTNVLSNTKYYYRVRAYSAGGNSAFSNTTNATAIGIPPSLSAIPNKTVAEGTLLTFTNTATAPDFDQDLNNFEAYAEGVQALFRLPNFSGSTATLLDSSGANVAFTTTAFPAGTNLGTQVLGLSWSFTNASNPWLRLTTGGASNMPNPVIDFTKKFKFNIYSDRAIKLALGCRETTNVAGTTLGSDGGSSGTIEWVGATNILGTGPAPVRTVPSNSWQTLSFHIPFERVTNFTGNGTLTTSSGLGVFEHLAFVPADGSGAYNVFLDNFVVGTPKVLTYSLEPGAPTGASVNATNGIFTWTPTEAQGPGSYNITIRVTDNAVPAQSATNTFTVTVTEANIAPTLTTITNFSLHAGTTLIFTNTATDTDLPANALTFSLTNPPTGAAINATNGIFTWTPSDLFANTTNLFAIKVTDNGNPNLSDSKNVLVVVAPRPSLQSISNSGGNFNFSWTAISGKKYRIQYKSDLSDANWTDLTDITADNTGVASFLEGAGQTHRFYRLVCLN